MRKRQNLFTGGGVGWVLLLLLLAACGAESASDPLPASVYTRAEIRDFVLAVDAPPSGDWVALTRNLDGPCWEVLLLNASFRYAVYVDGAGQRGPYVVARLPEDSIPLTRAGFDDRMAEWLAPTPTPLPRVFVMLLQARAIVRAEREQGLPPAEVEYLAAIRRPVPHPESLRCLELAYDQ